jgi:hypothetical protein
VLREHAAQRVGEFLWGVEESTVIAGELYGRAVEQRGQRTRRLT